MVEENNTGITRRKFLQLGAAIGSAYTGIRAKAAFPQAVVEAPYPLKEYPDRDWEGVYREQYRYDSTFRLSCLEPGCGNCKFTAFVRNGIIMRLEPSYQYQDISEMVSPSWNPRCCARGLNMHRRIYGASRIKYPMIRKGFLEGNKARGSTEWVRIPWDEAFDIIAKKLLDTMRRHGSETIKIFPAQLSSGPITNQGSAIRFANMIGATVWTAGDWGGYLAPGHAMATGVQIFDPELNDLQNCKLCILWLSNPVEDNVPDAHWMVEVMERGGKIVAVSPNYNSTAVKADYWLHHRYGTDIALALGMANVIIREKLYDENFIRGYGVEPLLVRLDTMQFARASGGSNTWGNFLVWDMDTSGPKSVAREDVGRLLVTRRLRPALEGTYTIEEKHREMQVKTVFQLEKERVEFFTPEQVEEITGTPSELVKKLARDYATEKPASIYTGQGYGPGYNTDLRDRALFFLATLTGNIGVPGGNIGHLSPNFHVSLLDGLPIYLFEDTENIDKGKIKNMVRFENPAYFVNGGPTDETGALHNLAPTRVRWHVRNNFLNHSQWQYNVIKNRDPHVSMIVVQDWEFTFTCEYADIVLPVHSWAETTMSDLSFSATNPFLELHKGGIKPIHESKMDIEIFAGVARKMAEITGTDTYSQYWRHVHEGNPEIYIQRVLEAGSTTRGLKIEDLRAGPKMLKFKTYPRIPGWEQVHKSIPFYTKTGRIEDYKEEDEFIRLAEHIITYKEPAEATPYAPLSQWPEAKNSKNGLFPDYPLVLLTADGRYGNNLSGRMADFALIWSSNFGDPWKTDRKSPGLGEAQLEVNPSDAESRGVKEGDYIWITSAFKNRPYQESSESASFYSVAKTLIRCKFNTGLRPGTTLVKGGWWSTSEATFRAQQTGLNGRSITIHGYRADYRSGSALGLLGVYIKPTQETDSLVRKNLFGHLNPADMGKGYESDVHSPCLPRVALVQINLAEEGSYPLYSYREDDAMGKYLAGDLSSKT